MKIGRNSTVDLLVLKLLPALHLFAVSLFMGDVQAQSSIQISDQMVVGGAVSDYLISPDGLNVVYLADQDIDCVQELYKVSINGGPSVKLNGALAYGSDVKNDFSISPDNSHVVFQVTTGAFFDEIYKVALSGGSAVKISSKARSKSDRGVPKKGFEISADSSRVVYRDTLLTNELDQLFSRPLSGGPAARIATPPMTIGTGSTLTDFIIDPSSTSVAYVSDFEDTTNHNLSSVPIGGGSTVPLSDIVNVPFQRRFVSRFDFSSDGQHLVYLAPQDPLLGQSYELYVVATSGGVPMKLNSPLINLQRLGLDFLISPDDEFVVYTIRENITVSEDKEELFSVPLAGGASTKLMPVIVHDDSKVFDYRISSDSRRVVYFSNHQIAGVRELYSVPIEGGSIVKLNTPILVSGNGNTVNSYSITPDSKIVVFVRRVSGEMNIFSVPIEGGVPLSLRSNTASGLLSASFSITLDSSRVLYIQNGLQSVPVVGGYSIVLHDELPTYGRLRSLSMSQDGNSVVYAADQDIFGKVVLFSRVLPTVAEHIPPRIEEICIPIKAQNGKVSLVCL